MGEKRLANKNNLCYCTVVTVTGGNMNRYRQLANQRGQTLVEFAMMLVVSALIAGALLLLFGMYSEYGWRILTCLAWEHF